ncbi:MAG: hypothetical protein Q4E38_07650 [Eubacteriales bacterium]|nr:hypothetical protein [Eubacteriales bacterium]
MKFKRFVLVLVLVIIVVFVGYSHSKTKMMLHSIPYQSSSTPKTTVKPVTTVKPTTRVAVSRTWTGAPYTGMYVPTVPEAWQWKGSDYHTVKSSYGKEMKTEKYLYYIGDNKYTIYVDKDDTVVKVELTAIRPEKSTAKTGKRRSVIPSPDTSGYYSAEDFYDYYRDDFSDYEDAEDYYNSHGGW